MPHLAHLVASSLFTPFGLYLRKDQRSAPTRAFSRHGLFTGRLLWLESGLEVLRRLVRLLALGRRRRRVRLLVVRKERDAAGPVRRRAGRARRRRRGVGLSRQVRVAPALKEALPEVGLAKQRDGGRRDPVAGVLRKRQHLRPNEAPQRGDEACGRARGPRARGGGVALVSANERKAAGARARGGTAGRCRAAVAAARRRDRAAVALARGAFERRGVARAGSAARAPSSVTLGRGPWCTSATSERVSRWRSGAQETTPRVMRRKAQARERRRLRDARARTWHRKQLRW